MAKCVLTTMAGILTVGYCMPHRQENFSGVQKLLNTLQSNRILMVNTFAFYNAVDPIVSD